MMNADSIKSFIKEIVENGNVSNKEETKNLLKNFKNYLETTTNISADEISKIEKILDCLDEIFIIKDKLGSCVDIDSFLDIEKEKSTNICEEKVKVKEKKIDNNDFSSKHYGHYIKDTQSRYSPDFRYTSNSRTSSSNHSSFCGGSSSSSGYNSSTGSSYTGRFGC